MRWPAFRPQYSALSLLSLACLIVGLVVAVPSSQPASAHADEKLEGAELFATRGCTHCHGPAGEGTDLGPRLRDVRRRLSAAQVKHQIVAGGKSMPAFGSILDDAQVVSLVVFLRAKTWPAAPASPPAAPGH